MKDITGKKVYVTGSADAAMLQMALIDRFGSSKISTPRFSWFLNAGSHFNKDLSKSAAIFTGLVIRNMGFVLKEGGWTTKHRIYALSVPLGLKLGNLKKGHLIVGGAVDLPFHYKEKYWYERKNKVKKSEWFSKKTKSVLPNAYLGYVTQSGMTLKGTFYPTNFMDEAYYNSSKLFTISLGTDVNRLLRNGTVEFKLPKKPNE